MKYSRPYTILEISKEENCTLKHELGEVAKKKYPLAYLKMYHERNLIVGSEEEENEFVEGEEVVISDNYNEKQEEKEESGIELGKLLDIFDNESTQEIDVKDGNTDFILVSESQPSIAERVFGLKKKKKVKRKRNIIDTGIKEERKKRITSVHSFCGLSQDYDDTLSDLDEEFHGDQSARKDPFTDFSNFTGKQSVNGDHDLSSNQILTGGLNVSGVLNYWSTNHRLECIF